MLDTPEDARRRKMIAVNALANAIEHEPVLRPVLVEDYANARLELRTTRVLRDVLLRRLSALSRHPDEPGSKSAVEYRDGLAPYGTEDTTGFGEGCVF